MGCEASAGMNTMVVDYNHTFRAIAYMKKWNALSY
jgi:hypothetical protein